MKKSNLVLLGVIVVLAVVVLGVAVYMGNTQTQKGSVVGFTNSQQTKGVDCGSTWTKVYGGTLNGGNITTNLPTNRQALQSLMDKGCSFKFVLGHQEANTSYIADGLSFECAYVQTTPAVDFQCTGSLDDNQYAPSAGLSFVGLGSTPSVILSDAMSNFGSSADSIFISLFAKK